MFVILPGAGRGPADFAAWRGVQVFRYPLASNLAAIVEHCARVIPADAVVVGESVGGLIALALAGRGFRAVAIDPPLTTQKQWAVQYAVRTQTARLLPEDPFHAHIEGLLGVMRDGSLQERVYYPLLNRITAPVDIITGDVPLWPYRGAGLNAACCIDDVDRYVLAAHPMVKLHEIDGPHALMDSRPAACRKVIEAALTPSPARR